MGPRNTSAIRNRSPLIPLYVAIFRSVGSAHQSATMDEDGRKDVALRLKAALWLAGRAGRADTNEDPVVPMSTTELARHELLVHNQISRSKLDEILRLRRDAKPMELRVIADALELPPAFLLSERPFDYRQPDAEQRRDLAEALETIRVLAERLQSER